MPVSIPTLRRLSVSAQLGILHAIYAVSVVFASEIAFIQGVGSSVLLDCSKRCEPTPIHVKDVYSEIYSG